LHSGRVERKDSHSAFISSCVSGGICKDVKPITLVTVGIKQRSQIHDMKEEDAPAKLLANVSAFLAALPAPTEKSVGTRKQSAFAARGFLETRTGPGALRITRSPVLPKR
jgi:hypothetical protein